MLNGHQDVFTDNKVVMTGHNVGLQLCHPPGKTVTSDNEYYTPNGTIQECGKPLREWQRDGSSNDPGSSVHKYPSDAKIIEWAKLKLFIH